jgi:hypothetical protein
MGAIGDWKRMMKVLDIGTSNKSTCGTRVKENMRRKRAVYSRERGRKR